MGRRKGSKNANYEVKRRELALGAMGAMLGEDGRMSSFRAISGRLGVDPATLRHYFGGMDGVFEAAFAAQRELSSHFQNEGLGVSKDPPIEGLMRWSQMFLIGWQHGLSELFHIALVGGMGHEKRGPLTLESFFEPFLGNVRAVLERYHALGQLEVADAKSASIMFTSPIIFMLIHQDSLGGEKEHGLERESFLEAHVRAFVAGHAPSRQE